MRSPQALLRQEGGRQGHPVTAEQGPDHHLWHRWGVPALLFIYLFTDSRGWGYADMHACLRAEQGCCSPMPAAMAAGVC